MRIIAHPLCNLVDDALASSRVNEPPSPLLSTSPQAHSVSTRIIAHPHCNLIDEALASSPSNA